MNEIVAKIVRLIREEGLGELDAWNKCSQQLISVARVYIDIFIIHANLSCICAMEQEANRAALSDLFELYMLYELCDVYPGNVLRLTVIDATRMNELRERMLNMLPVVRTNAVALVDAFDLPDSNLNSSLGAHDGQAYERLFEFARGSLMTEQSTRGVYEKHFRPYAQRHRQRRAKL
jgi:acyl-CoA oxidase